MGRFGGVDVVEEDFAIEKDGLEAVIVE